MIEGDEYALEVVQSGQCVYDLVLTVPASKEREFTRLGPYRLPDGVHGTPPLPGWNAYGVEWRLDRRGVDAGLVLGSVPGSEYYPRAVGNLSISVNHSWYRNEIIRAQSGTLDDKHLELGRTVDRFALVADAEMEMDVWVLFWKFREE